MVYPEQIMNPTSIMNEVQRCGDCGENRPVAEYLDAHRWRRGKPCELCRTARLNPARLSGPARFRGVRDGRKWCSGCETIKPVTGFSVDRSKATGVASRCLDCTAANNRRLRGLRTPDHGKAQWKALRDAAHAVYGGRCEECGSTDDLQWDHLNNDGPAHRAAEQPVVFMARIRRTGRRCERWALQLLCQPCHSRVTRERRRARLLAIRSA